MVLVARAAAFDYPDSDVRLLFYDLNIERVNVVVRVLVAVVPAVDDDASVVRPHGDELDASLLDLLYKGRVTPALAQTLLAERGIAEVSRQYINQRLGRLAEHEHTRNIEGSGVYELVADPRPGGDAIAEEHFKRLSVALGTPITVGEVVYEDGDKHPLSSDEAGDGRRRKR